MMVQYIPQIQISSVSLSIFLQAPGPMAEIMFWQERASVFNTMCEQLKHPVVKKILEVMNKADASIVQILEETVTELHKHRAESDDNARYLSTLERYFMVSCTLNLIFHTLTVILGSVNCNQQEMVAILLFYSSGYSIVFLFFMPIL